MIFPFIATEILYVFFANKISIRITLMLQGYSDENKIIENWTFYWAHID